MNTQRQGRGPRRERTVLVGAGVSSLALAWAAFAALGDPVVAGEAALARLAGEVSDGVVGEWNRLRRDAERVVASAADEDDTILSWSTESAPNALPPRELASDGVRDPLFDALLNEAEKLELVDGDSGAALDTVLEALARDPGEARLAAGRLRAIQLARRAGRDGVAREQWHAASGELAGAETRGGTSYLLLCALAAGPALDADERERTRARLATLWLAGELALPPLDAGPLRAVGDTRFRVAAMCRRRDVLRADVLALATESGVVDEWLHSTALRDRAEALAALLGQPPAAPADGTLGVHVFPGGELVCRRLSPTLAGGGFLPPGALGERLVLAVREAGLLPDGFAIGFGAEAGDDERTIVRERTDLAGPGLGFVLRHSDPESVIEAERERTLLLRVAFLLLAVFTAAAGASTFRALRRERLLGELKSSFVANVSHELRTPLSSILLMSENLEHGRVGDDARGRYHTTIRREAQRLRRLVDDVLDFSRMERGGRPRLRVADIELASFAGELEAEARERVEHAGGRLDFHHNGAPERARFDGEALRRAVSNLVDNALKHSGSDHVEIGLSSDGRGGLRVAVRDHGTGIPRARRAEVFAPFARLSDDSEAAPGAGLGLAIVREIAEAHGGHVELREPENGSGACFELFVPGEGNETEEDG